MTFNKIGLGLALSLCLTLPLAAAPAKKGKAAKPARLSASEMTAIEAKMKATDCFTCHQVKNKVVGPAYKDVAKKYKGDAKAVDTLVLKIKNGGSGNWGQVPMAGHPNLSDEDLKLMVRWVLAQK